jgi:prepilin-type N-terminal cleavage/methylation domain-containing protein
MNVRARPSGRAPRQAGYTLMDMMVVIVIMGVLGSLGFNQYGKYVARARRPEAVMAFRALAAAQREYLLRQGQYSGTFDALGFRVEGGQRISPTEIQGRRYNYRLIQDQGPRSWYCVATGNIDGDEFPDIISASNPR